MDFFKKIASILSLILGAVLLLTACQSASPELTKSQVLAPTPRDQVVALNPASYHAALTRYLQRAEQGDPIAENNLGEMFADARGVPEDNQKAVEWFKKSAARGYPPAEVNLAVAYLFGQGVDVNPRQACHLLQDASGKSNTDGRDLYQKYCVKEFKS